MKQIENAVVVLFKTAKSPDNDTTARKTINPATSKADATVSPVETSLGILSELCSFLTTGEIA